MDKDKIKQLYDINGIDYGNENYLYKILMKNSLYRNIIGLKPIEVVMLCVYKINHVSNLKHYNEAHDPINNVMLQHYSVVVKHL